LKNLALFLSILALLDGSAGRDAQGPWEVRRRGVSDCQADRAISALVIFSSNTRDFRRSKRRRIKYWGGNAGRLFAWAEEAAGVQVTVNTPVVETPGKAQVLVLEPASITPQNGKEKQDWELEAGKRWLETYGRFYAKQGSTILGDDLFCHQPFLLAVKSKYLHFILVCKPDAHPALDDMVALLEANGVLGHLQKRHWQDASDCRMDGNVARTSPLLDGLPNFRDQLTAPLFASLIPISATERNDRPCF
jgi:hypothetical protein